MAKLYVLCGIPGAGKTTAAYRIDPYAKVHSYDDVFESNRNADINHSSFQTWVSNIRSDLLAERNVVCDSTNLTVLLRKNLLKQFCDIDCEKNLVVFSTPIEECKKRNAGRKRILPDFVITQSAKMMEMPTLDEGWDNIYLWKDDEETQQ